MCTAQSLNDLFIKAFKSNPCSMAISEITEGKYIEVNDALLHTLGFSKDEVIGKTTTDLDIFVDITKRQEAIQIMRKKGYLRDFETRVRGKNNQIINGSFNAEFITIDGKTYLLTVMNDITAKKQLEQEVLHVEKLNLIGQLSAGISHEVRNPMTTVRGCLQLLMKKPEYSQHREYFQLMINELDKANLILSDFLLIMKSDPFYSKYSLKCLNEIINSIQPLIEANSLENHHQILYNITDTPKIMINEKEICQMIFNFVLNGFDAMPSGGILSIKTFRQDNQVVLAIQDHGSGIDKTVLSKLGTPFLTTKDKGTGLGLAVCYGIAHRHKAKIKVSTGSQGTTFQVYFPIYNIDRPFHHLKTN